VRGVRVWAGVLGVEGAVVKGVRLEQEQALEVLVVTVRSGWRQRGRCGLCRRRRDPSGSAGGLGVRGLRHARGAEVVSLPDAETDRTSSH